MVCSQYARILHHAMMSTIFRNYSNKVSANKHIDWILAEGVFSPIRGAKGGRYYLLKYKHIGLVASRRDAYYCELTVPYAGLNVAWV